MKSCDGKSSARRLVNKVEHAEGVHVSELDVGLKPTGELTRSMAEISGDIRTRLGNLPAAVSIGQPISHRIDHMLSGVRSHRGNFGLYFTWWDRWCGTEDVEYLRHGDAKFARQQPPDAVPGSAR